MKIFCDHAKRKLLQKGVTLRIHQRLLCSKSKVSLIYSFSPALLFLCSLDALFALFPHYNMFCGLTTQPVLFIENPAVLKLLLKMFKRKKHCSPSHRWKRIQKINRLRVWEWKTRHSAAKPCNISGPMSSSTVTQTVVKDRLLILFKIILKTSLQPFLFTFQRTGCHFKLSKGLALWRWWRLPCLPTKCHHKHYFSRLKSQPVQAD